jgi:hypothetical protein
MHFWHGTAHAHRFTVQLQRAPVLLASLARLRELFFVPVAFLRLYVDPSICLCESSVPAQGVGLELTAVTAVFLLRVFRSHVSLFTTFICVSIES